jgi:hypothetical protein
MQRARVWLLEPGSRDCLPAWSCGARLTRSSKHLGLSSPDTVDEVAGYFFFDHFGIFLEICIQFAYSAKDALSQVAFDLFTSGSCGGV